MVKFYRVGGCNRDELLGIKSKDIDFSVEAPSFDAMRDEILARNGEIFLETPQHFTIRARVPELGAADFVLCRKDGYYSDGRRPDTVEIGTLYDDLARRDFTMNAIAKDEEGNIIDPFNGREDIKMRLIRCVGTPRARFQEDSLRMLRAIRFAITKRFMLDNDVNVALNDEELIEGITNTSVERIRDELYKCFEFDTLCTLRVLMNTYPRLGTKVLDSKRIWLKPTLKPVD